MNHNRFLWLHWTLPSAVVVLLLWLPFGFSLQGLIEEWDVLRMFTESGVTPNVNQTSQFDAQWLRPLTVLPHAIAYLIDSDSFQAWHWMQIGALLVKGIAATYLAASITGSIRWGTFLGLLVILYPADTMQLSFRSLHINVSLALVLAATALLIYAQDLKAGIPRWTIVIAAVVLLLSAQLMYEVAFALTTLPGFVLWCMNGFSGMRARISDPPLPTAAWICSSAAYVLYATAGFALRTGSYQQDLTEGRTLRSIVVDGIPRLFDVGLLRAMVGGWVDASQIASGEFHNYAYLLLFGLVCCIFVALAPPRGLNGLPTRSAPLDAEGVSRMAATGLILLVVGYAPYLFSRYHIVISQRTFLFATPGAALLVLAAVLTICRFSKLTAGIAVAYLLTIGAAAQLFQFQHYVDISVRQQKILRTIVENLSVDSNKKTIVILDYSNSLSHTWLLRDHLKRALTYLQNESFSSVQICLMPSNDWQARDSIARTGRCIDDRDRWIFEGPAPLVDVASENVIITVPKSEAFVLTISPEGEIAGSSEIGLRQIQLAQGDSPQARRYQNILKRADWPFKMHMFAPREALDTYQWDFGTWWSLEKPTRGHGWREAEWLFGYFHRDAVAWKTERSASLMFDFSPKDDLYLLTADFSAILNAKIKDSLRIKVNQQELHGKWQQNGSFEALIPKGLLRHQSNTIELNSDVDSNYYDLSVQLTNIKVRPIGQTQ